MKNRETETSTPQRLNISALWKYGGRREASTRLSFVECHGLSVTRSKAAAGRQNEAAELPTAVGDDRWMGESLARCSASGRPADSAGLPVQSPSLPCWASHKKQAGCLCLRSRHEGSWKYGLTGRRMPPGERKTADLSTFLSFPAQRLWGG
jgi:hypothetical protein